MIQGSNHARTARSATGQHSRGRPGCRRPADFPPAPPRWERTGPERTRAAGVVGAGRPTAGLRGGSERRALLAQWYQQKEKAQQTNAQCRRIARSERT